MQPKPIFLHITKTAGTSFRFAIKDNYIGDELYEVDHKNFDPSMVTPNNKIIFGHLLYGAHYKLPTPYKYITLLREPIESDVSISLY